LFEQFKANETSFLNARNLDPCVQYASNLAQGNISQTIATNCAAQGIPNDYTGGAITSTIFSQGGIGVLDPETSKAKTASIILTPRFGFLPETRFSLAVDYFDITVRDQVSQLGAANILFQCYESSDFPNSPLCNLFTRGSGTDPYAVTEVQDKYINIARQRNRGLDFTTLIQHNLGGLGSITFLSSVTRQLEQSFALFADEEDDLLGVIDLDGGTRTGTRKWAGDFNLTWRAPQDLTLFYGIDFFSKASNKKEFKESNGGDLCVESSIRGDYCVDVSVPAVLYHSASITKELYERFELTVGMSNIFDKKPPRVSTIGGTGIPSLIGPVVGTSQYDLIGRRLFMNLGMKF
jgi:iron complex outermembrane receptor protein